MNHDLLGAAVENFRLCLNGGFHSLKVAYEIYVTEQELQNQGYWEDFDEFYHDWAQSCWELMVERPISSPGEFLLEYGSGSDYAGSRVFFRFERATHEVVCIPKGSVKDCIASEPVDLSEFSFEGFVTLKGTWFEISGPFDHVLLDERGKYGGDYRQIVVPLEQVEFGVQEIRI